MSDSLLGGCLCGSIRYEVNGEPILAVFCHCRDCQKAHAAPYAASAMVPAPAISVTSGSPRGFTIVGNSGGSVRREFCGSCGTQLFSSSDTVPNYKTIKIAALDNPAAIKPTAHIWTERQIEWACINDGLPRLPGQVTKISELTSMWAKRTGDA